MRGSDEMNHPNQGPDDRGQTEKLKTAREVARELDVRVKRVYALGIPAVRVSPRCLRYRPSDVSAWVKQRLEQR